MNLLAYHDVVLKLSHTHLYLPLLKIYCIRVQMVSYINKRPNLGQYVKL